MVTKYEKQKPSTCRTTFFRCKIWQICPGLNANEIQIPYGKHDKVSSLAKGHLNTLNSVKYEVI